MKYVKQVKTLEAAIYQKQKELDKKSKMISKKNIGKYFDGGDADEMTELIEPEHTGEEGKYEGLKQRHKESVMGETFEEFMRRRSKRISKFGK